GTVLGMIQAFRAMETAGRNVDPSILSGGIWAALLTTAAGLIVAIPVVAIASWFDRSILKIAHTTEDAVTRIFTPDLTRWTEGSADELRAANA
ncbi:MAG: MotA/TolQ/ExbB proton channel family protein, partial [Hyphomonas sp.]